MLSRPRVRLLPALTILLSLLGLACGGETPGTEPPAPQPQGLSADALLELELQAYRESSFGACDVKVLSAYWGSGDRDTKSMISSKILDGGEPLVSKALGIARQEALRNGSPSCTVDELGYTPADAQAVADNWGYSLSEAKSAMFNKYLNVGKQGLVEEVARSHGVAVERTQMVDGEGEEGAPMESIDGFYEFSDLCEAKMLAHLWGQGLAETKLRIGSKHLNGEGALVAEEVYRAYQSGGAPDCGWTDLQYGYEDAAVLAKHWGMSIQDTKATMVSKIRVGNRRYLEHELGHGH